MPPASSFETFATYTIPRLLCERASRNPHKVAYRYKRAGIYEELTWAAYKAKAESVAVALIELDLARGGCLAIMGNPCIEYVIAGETNLFEAVRALGLDPVIQLACSSEQYGLVLPDEVPIKETNPLRPLSPYAVSKVAQDLLGYQYWMSWKVDCVRTRGFNHEGPRRGPVFVASDFAKQIADIERGLKPPVIHVGNLEARRDFTDVRDMVKAYWLALEKGEPGEVYNLCSGKAYAIREVLDLLLGMTKCKIEVRQDPKRLRPSDVQVLLGDGSKFQRATGWAPRIPFERTLADTLDHWRAQA
jgi:GDP-4-dehydro-6-deoxy-D-mannose reductase